MVQSLNKQSKTKPPIDAPEIALRIFMCCLALLVGIGIFIFFKVTKPKTVKTKPDRIPPLVDFEIVRPENHQIEVSALGTVTAEKEVTLKSRLSGEIIMMSPEFIPGGFFKKGDVILKIDPADYLLDIKRKKAAVSSAKATLDIELGYQDVAREELTLMEVTSGKKVKDKELALRKPQLNQVQAKYDAARADMEAARLNLNRTVIRAPFNCMVTTRLVNIGEQVSAQSGLGNLIGTDSYWIKASVPVSQLKWIDIPKKTSESGSRVRIKNRNQFEADGTDSTGLVQTGKVISLTGTLNDKSRMATVLVSVDDPLLLNSDENRPPLILGSYVSLSIEGKTIGNTIAIPRKALRDNNSVWVYSDGQLIINRINALWKGNSLIYLRDGLKNGDAIVVSSLSSPVEGMKLTDKEREKHRKTERKKAMENEHANDE